MGKIPSGTVTFIFTDIEGSTKLAQHHSDKWESLRGRHQEILKSAIETNNGYVFQIIGDAFCAAFHNAGDALQAALQSQINLHNENWGDTPVRVRMGIHTGKAELQVDGQYYGYLAMSRVQRVMSAAHGGQTLLSNACAGLVRNELPEGITLLDMKEHRLKGLLNPEHLWQIVAPGIPRDFPPLASLNDIPNNLPTQLTTFIGREKEIEEVKQALSEHRLVTLTGSGGTGKSRLSLQVAADLLDSFPDGTWLIELAPLSDPDLISGTIQDTLGLVEQRGISILQALQEYLSEKEVLLILDNCEHLIEACARLSNDLLSHSTKLKILASSREALGVQGEVSWRLPSLSLPDTKHIPDPEELSQYEAVQLFIERASLIDPHFDVNRANAPAIAQICYRLGGIPLAIELAAARIKALSVEQINTRLDDRFRLLTGGARTALPRQQTLRATIDWSYNLLSEKEKSLFRRLAVFVGGWSLEAAESVCSDEGLNKDEILDLMSNLVDKSIINTEEFAREVRYHRLETIRQYAREKFLDTDEVENIRDRHLQYYLELAEQAEPEVLGQNQVTWLNLLEEELDNLRSALEWSQHRDVGSFLRLGSALWRYWMIRHIEEGIGWMSKALNATKNMRSKSRSIALARFGNILMNHGDFEQAKVFANQALELGREVDDKLTIAEALIVEGNIEGGFRSNKEAGTKLLEQGLNLSRENGYHWLAAIALLFKGRWEITDNPASNKITLEEGLKEARLSGDKRLISYLLSQISVNSLIQGDPTHAKELILEALALGQEINDILLAINLHNELVRVGIIEEDYQYASEQATKLLKLARSQNNRGMILIAEHAMGLLQWAQGNTLLFFAHAQAELDIAREQTNPWNTANALQYFIHALIDKGETTRARSCVREHLLICKDTKTHYLYYDSFELVAALALAEQQYEKCARFMAVRGKLRRPNFSFYQLPLVMQLGESHITRARQQLGEEAFNKAWEEGKAMTVEEAIEYALRDTNE